MDKMAVGAPTAIFLQLGASQERTKGRKRRRHVTASFLSTCSYKGCRPGAPTEEEQQPSEPAEEVQQEEAPAEPVPEVRYSFCPDGWFSHQSRCFRFINTPMNWYNAEEHCNSLGGHLASNISPREYSFLQQMVQTGGQSAVWLGGFNLQGRWMWIDREGLYYTNWYSQLSTSSYPCLYLHAGYGWRNQACSSSYRFICSKNPFGC